MDQFNQNNTILEILEQTGKKPMPVLLPGAGDTIVFPGSIRQTFKPGKYDPAAPHNTPKTLNRVRGEIKN